MRILIIGLGSIARKHIEAIRQLRPEAEISALRSSREASEMEEIFNLYSLNDLEELPDFVIISNPTGLHYETISQLIELKIPLFIEKPSLDTLHGAEELSLRIRENNILTYVACNLRFHPALSFLKRYVSDTKPRINEVNVYVGSYLPDWRPGRDFRQIYSANKEMGGGVHLDLIHELDYTYWFFGAPLRFQRILRNASSLGISAVDYANYVLVYENFTAGIILNYYRRDTKRTIEILTDNETITADILKCKVQTHTGKVLFENNSYKPMDTYIGQIKYFMDCLENNTAPMNTFDESLEVLKICLDNAEIEG